MAAEELPVMKLGGVKAKYSLDESVPIQITNLSSRVVTYGIGVVTQMGDGTWTEFLTNINDHEMINPAFRLLKLPGNQSQVMTWKPKDVTKPDSIKKGVFRFYLAYKNESGRFGAEISHNIGSQVGKTNRQLIFSDAFELHP